MLTPAADLSPFADITPVLAHLPAPAADQTMASDALCAKAAEKFRGFDPLDLRPVLAHLQSWQQRVPVLAHPRLCAFASHYPGGADVTQHMITELNGAHHPLKRLAALLNADLRVYELDLAQDARDARQAAQAMTYGMLAIEDKGDVVIVASLSEGAEQAAIALAWPQTNDPDALLRALVPQIGLDFFAALGACLAARLAGQPVLVSGAFGQALIQGLTRLEPSAAAHLLWCQPHELSVNLPPVYTPVSLLQRLQFALAFLPAPQKTVHLSAIASQNAKAV